LDIQRKLHKIPTEQHEFIALWQVTSENSNSEKNIFLTHGTYSNRKVLLPIAEYLAKNGYQCWIMEWRNHGKSSPSKVKRNFELIGKIDLPITFNCLFNQLKINNLNCVMHSGGGIVISICLLHYPELLSKFNRMVFFGTQTHFAAFNFKNEAIISIGKMMCNIMGYSPGKWVGSPHNEDKFFMNQWFDWNLKKRFVGIEGRDYEKELYKIQIPILSVCGGGDKFIAPPSACKKYLDAFQNPQNRLLLCSKKTGFKEDYNHSRLIQSRNAKAEIWEKALDWLRQ